jgi:hypothetical protein
LPSCADCFQKKKHWKIEVEKSKKWKSRKEEMKRVKKRSEVMGRWHATVSRISDHYMPCLYYLLSI